MPTGYRSRLDVRTTEAAIPRIKICFERKLCDNLNLQRVSAPLFVKEGTGINDDLNGSERPVSFEVKGAKAKAQIVHSLAKWKRAALANYGFTHGVGLYTDMNAIRADEELDYTHSAYVDQWDWERVISREERCLGFLRAMVSRIYDAIKSTERMVFQTYGLEPLLSPTIHFISAAELEKRLPHIPRKEREDRIAKELGAVFLIGIGAPLEDGEPHDGRAPDYDDWITPTDEGRGLNGDIIVWNPVLESAFELSSMGIRVDKASLAEQLKLSGAEDRLNLQFHRMLMNDELPLSIGGGIGQSRLCMLLLQKAHIGEVQAGIWPEEMERELAKQGIRLL